jgi:3-deoxy-manno-octulosonate cytidylyltransferase (CMP-KDO synthetase)
MKKFAMIPARYSATRFPFKLMQRLGDKSVIRHTHDNVLATKLFDEVIVVTDSDIIFREIADNGGKAIMSINEHNSGSDRIAEAIADMDVDIVLNVQGDEPFISAAALRNLLLVFELDRKEQVQVASLMKKFTDKKLLNDHNYVKVVTDKNMNSLLFSRSVIPFHRDKEIEPDYYEHVGVYAFRKKALLQFTNWEATPLELVEKIECLRYLENGISLKMVITEEASVKIDVPEDLEKAELFLRSK